MGEQDGSQDGWGQICVGVGGVGLKQRSVCVRNVGYTLVPSIGPCVCFRGMVVGTLSLASSHWQQLERVNAGYVGECISQLITRWRRARLHCGGAVGVGYVGVLFTYMFTWPP